jgi:ABC-type multidrug transport system ATPase subunit
MVLLRTGRPRRFVVEVKRQIGVVPEGMALFGRLTGSEYLNFVGRMRYAGQSRFALFPDIWLRKRRRIPT